MNKNKIKFPRFNEDIYLFLLTFISSFYLSLNPHHQHKYKYKYVRGIFAFSRS